MEKQEQIDYTVRVFTVLMKRGLDKSFSFPGGGIAQKAVTSCLEKLEKLNQTNINRERILDFCVCQVYTISCYDKGYLLKWNATHSFSKKAIERFSLSTKKKKFYEDKWLSSCGMSRISILEEFADKSEHPLFKFVYPEYEDSTKLRLHNKEAGYVICQLSTLLWTPFSFACQTCIYDKRCREVLARKFSEIFRLRSEEYKKINGHEWR